MNLRHLALGDLAASADPARTGYTEKARSSKQYRLTDKRYSYGFLIAPSRTAADAAHLATEYQTSPK